MLARTVIDEQVLIISAAFENMNAMAKTLETASGVAGTRHAHNLQRRLLHQLLL
jgi:hypothetical protein